MQKDVLRTAKKILDIEKLYRAGKKCTEIAREVGFSSGVVWGIRKFLRLPNGQSLQTWHNLVEQNDSVLACRITTKGLIRSFPEWKYQINSTNCDKFQWRVISAKDNTFTVEVSQKEAL